MKFARHQLGCSSLLVNCFLHSSLLILHLPEAITLKRVVPFYYTNEGENVSVECSATYFIRLIKWKLNVPENYTAQLDDTHWKSRTQDLYGVEIQLRNTTVSSTGGTETHFFLDIARVKANMSHSVVQCGVEDNYIEVIYIIVNRIEPVVTATRDVYYATDTGVTLFCLHSCNWTSLYPDYLLLWKLQPFNYQLGTLELHDNDSRTMAENELEVEFNMASDDSCNSGDDFNTFYLDIVGMSDMLQHAVISCGVRVDRNSPEVYSSTDSYIIINETNMDSITTTTKPATIPNTTDILITERVVAIVTPTAIGAFLVGLGIGAVLAALIVYLRKRRTELDRNSLAKTIVNNMTA